MADAVASLERNSPAGRSTPPRREEVVARYRQLREISKHHHSQVLKFISQNTILQHARRLGLAQGKTFILDDMEELNFAFDLAIHTAPADRARAIDRYARSAQPQSGRDEMLMLDAMCVARFSILRIERRHDVVGLIATDLSRETDLWLVDIGLESSVPDGSVMATRLYTPEQFSMTAGVNVPLDLEMLESLIAELPRPLCGKELPSIVDDRRFAETIYRIALASGVMERMKYQDPPTDIR
jgi:hypothetical protein